MKRRLWAVMLIISLVLSTVSVEKGRKVQAASETQTFEQLSQTQIVKAMGAGWNLGNQLEAVTNQTPSETAWGNPVITKKLIQTVKNAGFDTIRIPVSYFSKIGAAPSYTIDAAWLKRVKEVVDYAISCDMFVIINMHGDGYHTIDGGWLFCDAKDQTQIIAKYKACWQQIADTFKDYDEHLIFESMNEEFDGTYGNPSTEAYENINIYNQTFVDTVRQSGGNNAMRWLLVPGWNTNIYYTTGDYGFKIPTDTYLSKQVPAGQKRIMISVHYYDPWDFCGAEDGKTTQWGNQAVKADKVASYGGEAHMQSQMELLKSTFTSKGYPVVIGEYGAIDKTSYDSTNNQYRANFAKRLCTLAKQNGCVPVYWDNGWNGKHGFGLFNRSSHKVTHQEIINAIVGVYGKKTVYLGPKATNIKKITAKKNGTLIIRWKKATGANGYQIVLGTNRKMTKNKKVINIKKGKTTKTTIKKLKKKKLYYIKIRAYKKVNGVKFYSKYSNIKKKKTKK